MTLSMLLLIWGFYEVHAYRKVTREAESAYSELLSAASQRRSFIPNFIYVAKQHKELNPYTETLVRAEYALRRQPEQFENFRRAAIRELYFREQDLAVALHSLREQMAFLGETDQAMMKQLNRQIDLSSQEVRSRCQIFSTQIESWRARVGHVMQLYDWGIPFESAEVDCHTL